MRDYDEAIAFYKDSLGFTLVGDKPVENKCRVLVASASGGGGVMMAIIGVIRKVIGR